MGQYYRPVIFGYGFKRNKPETITAVAGLNCYRFGNGAKLMEHSYVSNNYVNAVATLLAGKFKGRNFAWIGDYADTIDNTAGPDEEDNGTVNGYSLSTDKLEDATLPFIPTRYYCEDEAKKYERDNSIAVDNPYKYVLNDTKKQYVVIPDDDPDLWLIHPLPLLTCYGNGRGGGDYCPNPDKPEANKYVGKWAFDRITVANEVPDGYKEIKPVFSEKYLDEHNAKVLAEREK